MAVKKSRLKANRRSEFFLHLKGGKFYKSELEKKRERNPPAS